MESGVTLIAEFRKLLSNGSRPPRNWQLKPYEAPETYIFVILSKSGIFYRYWFRRIPLAIFVQSQNPRFKYEHCYVQLQLKYPWRQSQAYKN